MAIRGLILCAVFAGFVAACYGEILLSQLPKTLTVTTSPSGQVDLKAGEGVLTVSWELTQGKTIDTSSYKTVKAKLCYTTESQKDRPWRKTEDHLKKDKTCQHEVGSKPFSPTEKAVVTYKVKKDVPTATYFVRAYVFDANDNQVAYGETSDKISVTAISGRHVSLDIASAVFSAFSVISLAGFFYREKKKAARLTS